MGYTHYWKHSARFTKPEWKVICEDVNAILTLAMAEGMPLADGMGEVALSAPSAAFCDLDNGPGINFNGMGEAGFETFSIYQNRRPLEDWQEKARRGCDFTKTGRRVYDSAVVACLCYLESVYPAKFTASSDGNPGDWQEGLTLAKRALPRLGNVLRIPQEVAFDSQWRCYPISGARYAVAERIDGAICILKGLAVLVTFPAGDVAKDIASRVLAMLQDDPARRGWCKTDVRARWHDRKARLLLEAAPMLGGTVAA